jgi:hypothetical protein
MPIDLVQTAPRPGERGLGIEARVIIRLPRPCFRARIEVSHVEGLRAWGAVAATFEQRLAAQAIPR